MELNINGYKYDRNSRDLIYTTRDCEYYRDCGDPLRQNLYELCVVGTYTPESIFYQCSPYFVLNDIFFVCACLYEDETPEQNIDSLQKYLGWTHFKEKDSPLWNDHCFIYACVVAVLEAQKILPQKLQLFVEAAKKCVAATHWAARFEKGRQEVYAKLCGTGDTPQKYETDLLPDVSFMSKTYVGDCDHQSARVLLSRVRDEEECKKAIYCLRDGERELMEEDPEWKSDITFTDGFCAELRAELEATHRIGKEPYNPQAAKKQPSDKEQIAQLRQQLAAKEEEIKKLTKENETLRNAPQTAPTTDKDAKIAQLTKDNEELKEKLKTAGEEYVCRIVADELKGTEKMSDGVRSKKYDKMEFLLTMKGVPEKAKDAIKALLISNNSDAPQTTINNFNGPVGQVANNIEEQHITKEKKQ